MWLAPEQDVQAEIDAAIADYARASGRPAFAAHLTLASGGETAAATREALLSLAARHDPMELERDGVLRTARFSQAFAIRFRTTGTLLALRENALALCGQPVAGIFTPHISLTYGEPPETRTLEEFVGSLPARIRFDRVCWAEYADPFETDDAVASMQSHRPAPLNAARLG